MSLALNSFFTGPFVTVFCLRCDGILSLGYILMDLRVLVPLKITCNLVYQKILLNSSLRPETYGTEMKIFLLISKPVSGFSVELLVCFLDFLFWREQSSQTNLNP